MVNSPNDSPGVQVLVESSLPHQAAAGVSIEIDATGQELQLEQLPDVGRFVEGFTAIC